MKLPFRKKRSSLEKRSAFDWVMDSVIYLIMAMVLVVIGFPILYMVAKSFSGREAVMANKVYLWPVDFTLDNYMQVLQHEWLPKGFLNSVFYTVVGGGYSLILTILGAYALSRKKFFARDGIMLMISFTMLFGGGMIPTYILVDELGLIDSRWALVIPMAISQFNLIVMRTSMMSVSYSLEESAKIDGANDFTIMMRIFLPLSKPVVATIGLFYAAGQWNDYFSGLMFLSDKNKYPLQLLVRDLLIVDNDSHITDSILTGGSSSALTAGGFQAAVVVVTALPLLIAYPFIQKYFVKGVMIGAVKE